jgi:hypothetical protein
MSSLEEVLDRLRRQGRPDQLAGMARYGLAIEKRLGVAIPAKTARWIAADALRELQRFR